MGKFKVFIKLRSNPYGAGVYSAMIWWILETLVRCFPVYEGSLDVGVESGLVLFDGKKVVCAAPHDVFGRFFLSKKSVGSDSFSRDFYLFQGWDKHPDFVCLLRFFAIFVYR